MENVSSNAVGVDVSLWDNVVDFGKMRASAEFVFIKAGQNREPDKNFRSNWNEAKKAGMPRGSYWFYDSRAKPEQQAQLWMELLQGDFGELPLVIDLEETYEGRYLGWKNWRIFIEQLKEMSPGKEVAIFTRQSYWRNNTLNPATQASDIEYFRQYPLWIAHYGAVKPSIPIPWSADEWLFWQYTDKGDGTLYGVESGKVDLNYFNGDLNAFQARFGIRSSVSPAMSQEISDSTTDVVTGNITQTNLSEPVIYKAMVVATTLNVRNGAGPSYQITRTLKKDAVVEVFEEIRNEPENNYWGRIGPGQWISISDNTAVKISEDQEAIAQTDQFESDTQALFNVRIVGDVRIHVGRWGALLPTPEYIGGGSVHTVLEVQQDAVGTRWGRIGPEQWFEMSAQNTIIIQEEGVDSQSDQGDSSGDVGATDDEIAKRLQAAIAANRLVNNRSQPVYNDRAEGEDQLGIKDEVNALADTLLLRLVEPPIAVGVMGGWGSGKSFVMHLIKQHVSEIRAKKINEIQPVTGAETKTGGSKPVAPIYAGHIYQISFNAWTYAKSNLWASLMDTIFTNLNQQIQLERLLAYKDISQKEMSEEEDPSKKAAALTKKVHAAMMAGGKEFAKIYVDNIQLDQDEDLKTWRDNLIYWSHLLLKENLLWNIMRGQQVATLDKLKDTEEQLNQLKTRREQFEKDRSLNEITAQSLKRPARQAYFQSIKSFMLAFLSDELSNVAKEELKKQDVKEEDIQKFLDEAKGLQGGINTIIAAFRRSKLYIYWTLIFLLLNFAVPYLWSTYAMDFIQRRVAQAVSFFLMILPTLIVILPWIKKSISLSLEAKKILEGAYVTQQAKQAEEIANSTDKPLPQKISELQADVSEGSLAAYDALIGLLETQAEQQRQQIGPSAKYSNLLEFVQSRLDAATYETQLGLMHQVRQDIDELTYSLVDSASQDVFPRGKPRVILYIDDLDRCPPQRVVEVLEAVQLLLSTKLFIVVLGLDTRYVTRALEKEYKEILQHEGDPSGLDYIEKIIQIPYRVRPIEKDNLQIYLKGQMEFEQLSTDARDKALKNGSASQPGQQAVAGSDTAPADKSSTPAGSEKDIPKAEVGDKLETPKPEEVELDAAVIQFKQEDLEDLTACCQKIALTPRGIKRLVNVLKLMKIFWFRAIKDDRPRPIRQAAISMLALSSAYPEVMREAFVSIENMYRQGREETDLFTILDGIKFPPGSAREMDWQLQKYKGDLSTLKTISGPEQDKFCQISLKDFGVSTFNIVRSFSFVGDPVYWTDGEDKIINGDGLEQKNKAQMPRAANKKKELRKK